MTSSEGVGSRKKFTFDPKTRSGWKVRKELTCVGPHKGVKCSLSYIRVRGINNFMVKTKPTYLV